MLYTCYVLLQLRKNPFASKLTYNPVGRLLTEGEVARSYTDCIYCSMEKMTSGQSDKPSFYTAL